MLRLSWFDNGTLLAFAAVTPVCAFGAGLAPSDPTMPVTVVFAPWTTSADAIARVTQAGGRLVGPTGVDFAVLAWPDDHDFSTEIRGAGALLVIDPRNVPFCGPATPEGAS